MGKKGLFPIIDFGYFIVGCFIYAAAVTMFISANEISPGGFTGIATVINYLTQIPTGITVLALNIPIIIIGYIKMGSVFILKTAVATVIMSVSLDITAKILKPIETDNMLACLFGGILMGLGLSLVLLRGATTGGVDIIAKLINRKRRHISVGRVILIMDAVIIGLAAFVYKNIESALYSVLAMYISSKVMDTVLYGADKGKIIYAITASPDSICRDISERVHRGVTRIGVTGGYTGEQRIMLMCTLRRHEVATVHDIILEHDSKAFIVVGDVGEIIGEGFKVISN